MGERRDKRKLVNLGLFLFISGFVLLANADRVLVPAANAQTNPPESQKLPAQEIAKTQNETTQLGGNAVFIAIAGGFAGGVLGVVGTIFSSYYGPRKLEEWREKRTAVKWDE